MKRRLLARALFGSVLVGAMSVASTAPAGADTAVPPLILCQHLTTKVSITPGAPQNVILAGTLCRPGLFVPATVQLLVHGATYNQSVWDWPRQPDTYSYVRDAVSAGYATFSVDRIGHGASDKPPSAAVTVAANATALHDVVVKLRTGAIGGVPFRGVVWVGHSLGAVIAYDYGGRFTDINAYVLTGSIHFMKPSWIQLIVSSLQPAGTTDPGYLTTIPGTRASLFYYTPNADPAVIADDEKLKDTVAGPEVDTGLPLVSIPPDQSPTRNIRVPVLVELGEHDNVACDGIDGIKCTTAAILGIERPYFPNASRLDAAVVPNTGHVLSQHRNAPAAHAAVLGWLAGLPAFS